ncbi:hypothetical protein [Mesorhizobium sp. M0047]|uniref:hypothetical protein n=1 Tax=Mesorhizobium sp. M0047 TaxID=2956859 RepID=UPI003338E85F
MLDLLMELQRAPGVAILYLGLCPHCPRNGAKVRRFGHEMRSGLLPIMLIFLMFVLPMIDRGGPVRFIVMGGSRP